MVGNMFISVRIKQETHERYKEIKKYGYTWNAILNRGITHIVENEIGQPINNIAVIEKLQKKLTAVSSENELLRHKFKRLELREKLEKGEITEEEYNTFKQMYDGHIELIERRSGEERRKEEE